VDRALVLNASYQPICVVPARRAVVLVLKEKADVLVEGPTLMRGATLSLQTPSVIRLRYFVKVPIRARAALSRRAVFVRDDHACQYCGANAENLDHVIPRSRGGEHVWENVVAACRRCNAKKENRLLSDVGLTLARRPSPPPNGFSLAMGRLEPGWEPYLAPADHAAIS
jgi:5-methylcytosine-specific restriction endonuclease McrA